MAGTSCTFDGLSNTALGSATLSINGNGHLLVANIGSSGQDGVSQHAPNNQTKLLGMGLECPNFAAAITGTRARIEMYGDLPNPSLCSILTVEGVNDPGPADTKLSTTFDMSPVGTSLYTVKGMLGSMTVKMLTGQSLPVLMSPLVDYEDMACGIDPNGKLTIHYRLTNAVPVMYPDATTVNSDEIWVTAENMGPTIPTTQTRMDALFRNTGNIIINNETFLPVPTLSEWGVAVMVLLVLSAATILIHGRRPATA